jgi:hypothetical protein
MAKDDGSYIVTPQTAASNMNILIYGSQGVGKTVFAASAHDSKQMKGVLFLNAEGGLISVASRGDIRAVDLTSIEQNENNPTGFSLEEMFWKLANNDPAYKDIRTVVIDSVTELQTMNLEELVEAAIKKNPGKYKDRSRDEIYQEDYGKSTTMLKRLFRWFRDLDRNVIWTALPKFVYPKGADLQNAEPLAVLPSLTAKLGDSLMGYVDFVWYMYQSEETDEDTKEDLVVRHLLTQSRGAYRAKTRGMKFADAIGARVDNPNMAELYDLFMKSEGSK